MKNDPVYRSKVRQFCELVQMSHATIQDLFEAAKDLRPKTVQEGIFEMLRNAETNILCARYALKRGLRLDQMKDKEMDAILEQCVIQGHMVVSGKNDAGEVTYRLTDKGKQYVESMIGTRRN